MRVMVSSEHRFHRTPDGRVWTDSQCPYGFWRRYLEVFDHVDVLARVAPAGAPRSGWREATGPDVTFECVPYYVGPWQYLRKRSEVQRAVCAAAARADAILLRVGSNLAGCVEGLLLASGRPYAVEVVSDPYDVFAPGVVRHPFRPFFRYHFTTLQRRLCANACAAAYVTERTLQARYPCARMQVEAPDVELSQANVYSTHFSSVELVAADYSNVRRVSATPPYRLITVGSLAQRYKGIDVLIEAAALCVRRGLDITVTVVGDGKLRRALEAQASASGIGGRVQFVGALPSGAAVQEQLDAADLFVLASRTEGLPRAMIEAMARALPCIGTDVGGIPELLPPEDLVPPGNAAALADRIMEVVGTSGRLAQMSARSLAVARGYHASELHARRLAFYQFFRRAVEQWNRAGGAAGAACSGNRGSNPSVAEECRG
jgi:glycosyltransferase involved in cell wall biosynthesis